MSDIQELKVSLDKPSISSPGGYKIIKVNYGGYDHLEISLRQTIRVPDNGTSYALPPDCSPFPIYSVNSYKKNLPESMTAKGDLFIPIYGRLDMSQLLQDVYLATSSGRERLL